MWRFSTECHEFFYSWGKVWTRNGSAYVPFWKFLKQIVCHFITELALFEIFHLFSWTRTQVMFVSMCGVLNFFNVFFYVLWCFEARLGKVMTKWMSRLWEFLSKFIVPFCLDSGAFCLVDHILLNFCVILLISMSDVWNFCHHLSHIMVFWTRVKQVPSGWLWRFRKFLENIL